jgi:hypothetical protein
MIDHIKDRFIEAADVERRSPRERLGPSTKLGYWPEYQASFEDKAGWGSARLAEEREMRFRRLPPSAAAISRYEEVLLVWTAEYLDTEYERRLVWFWAFSKAGGRSFSAICRKKGWSRDTANNRLKRLFARISAKVVNDPNSLSRNGNIPDCTTLPPVGLIPCTLNELPEAQSPRSWNDGSTSADQPDMRDFSWAAKQAEREARKRRKAEAGMPCKKSEAA